MHLQWTDLDVKYFLEMQIMQCIKICIFTLYTSPFKITDVPTSWYFKFWNEGAILVGHLSSCQ